MSYSPGQLVWYTNDSTNYKGLISQKSDDIEIIYNDGKYKELISPKSSNKDEQYYEVIYTDGKYEMKSPYTSTLKLSLREDSETMPDSSPFKIGDPVVIIYGMFGRPGKIIGVFHRKWIILLKNKSLFCMVPLNNSPLWTPKEWDPCNIYEKIEWPDDMKNYIVPKFAK